MNSIGYGLDLSGYSGGNTRLSVARQTADEQIEVTILRNSIFEARIKGDADIRTHIGKEIGQLEKILKDGVIAVDIPVDLQGLSHFSGKAKRLWELTLRPVDKAFDALPPLASLIGSPVARFQYLLANMQLSGPVDNCVYETYPKASLDIRNITSTGYKNCFARWEGERWFISNGKTGKTASTEGIMKSFSFKGSRDGLRLDDNDIDSAICALTALAATQKRQSHIVYGDKLDKTIRQKLLDKGLIEENDFVRSPQGYVLLGEYNWFETVTLREQMSVA
jgi:hypothetical protein